MFIPFQVNGGTSQLTFYVPVPKKGRVRGVRAAANKTVATDDTLSLQRDSSEVNKITVGSGNTAAGTTWSGTPDSSNKNLEFDPNSETVAHKAIKCVLSALTSADTIVSGYIDYDEFGIPDRS